jgi:hypothetical protein
MPSAAESVDDEVDRDAKAVGKEGRGLDAMLPEFVLSTAMQENEESRWCCG